MKVCSNVGNAQFLLLIYIKYTMIY